MQRAASDQQQLLSKVMSLKSDPLAKPLSAMPKGAKQQQQPTDDDGMDRKHVGSAAYQSEETPGNPDEDSDAEPEPRKPAAKAKAGSTSPRSASAGGAKSPASPRSNTPASPTSRPKSPASKTKKKAGAHARTYARPLRACRQLCSRSTGQEGQGGESTGARGRGARGHIRGAHPRPRPRAGLRRQARSPWGGSQAYKAKALFKFEAKSDLQLSFKKVGAGRRRVEVQTQMVARRAQGDIMTIVEEREGGWWLAEMDGKQGAVPYNYVQRV